MNKTEFVETVASMSGLSRKDAGVAVESVLTCITETLERGGSVSIMGFGTFEVRERKERTGRDPHTGESMTIPASKRPAFKAGKALKDAVAKK